MPGALHNLIPNVGHDETTRRWLAIDAWCLAQLSADDLAFVRTFQPTVEIAFGDGQTVLCFHGSPRSNRDALRATTPEAELANLLGNTDATVLAGGHTHEQLLRRVGRSPLLNPGKYRSLRRGRANAAVERVRHHRRRSGSPGGELPACAAGR